MDALEKSNTKLTEEVRNLPTALGSSPRGIFFSWGFVVCLSSLQSQITESSLYKKMWREWRRKAPISWSPGRWALPWYVCTSEEALSFLVLFQCHHFQAVRSDSASDGQALGETRKQLKEETLLRLVCFRPFSARISCQISEFIYRCWFLRA